jgi:hypothetical protein
METPEPVMYAAENPALATNFALKQSKQPGAIKRVSAAKASRKR